MRNGSWHELHMYRNNRGAAPSTLKYIAIKAIDTLRRPIDEPRHASHLKAIGRCLVTISDESSCAYTEWMTQVYHFWREIAPYFPLIWPKTLSDNTNVAVNVRPMEPGWKHSFRPRFLSTVSPFDKQESARDLSPNARSDVLPLVERWISAVTFLPRCRDSEGEDIRSSMAPFPPEIDCQRTP